MGKVEEEYRINRQKSKRKFSGVENKTKTMPMILMLPKIARESGMNILWEIASKCLIFSNHKSNVEFVI